MKTKCCQYEIDPARPVVMWNEYNGVVQCHNCGHVYEPKIYGPELEGMRLIRHERLRQVRMEGWSPEHDDGHKQAEMAAAAVCYGALAVAQQTRHLEGRPSEMYAPKTDHVRWPWDDEWWKPSNNAIRNLVKAGALIAAEIDRLVRAKQPVNMTPWAGAADPIASPTWPLVLWFAQEMEKKLRENAHKGDGPEGWRPVHPWELVEAMLDQTVSVQELFQHDGNSITVTEFAKLISKCANVANYAMMIADQAKEAIRTQKEGTEKTEDGAHGVTRPTGEGEQP